MSFDPPPWARALGLTSTWVTSADGTRLRVLVTDRTNEPGAAGRPRVLLLHGFPQNASAWRRLAAELAGEARLVIPDLRGYGASELARTDDYDIETLVADVAAIEEATRGDDAPGSALLVAHDWGGPIAWHTLHRRPDLIRGLVATNAPHFAAYTRQLAGSGDQRRRSWYVAVFQVPFAERVLAAQGGRGFREIFAKTAPAGLFTERDVDDFVGPLLEPGRARAALSYYRQAARRLARDRASILDLRPTAVPAIIVWGQADAAISREHPDACAAYAVDLEVRRLDGISHWVPEQAPDALARAVRDLDARTR